MSSTSSPTLTCDVHARRADRCVALLAPAAGAVGMSLVTSFDTLTTCMLLPTSVFLICGGLWRARWIGARRIASFTWLADGRWQLTDRGGASTEATLRKDSRVGSHWVWLRWQAGDRSWNGSSLLLNAGDVSAHELRRLVLRLRIDGSSRNTPVTAVLPA